MNIIGSRSVFPDFDKWRATENIEMSQRGYDMGLQLGRLRIRRLSLLMLNRVN